MQNKFKKFYDFIVNQGIEISDKTNVYQCMDLAYAWVFFLNFPKDTIQHGYAFQVFSQPNASTRNYFDLIPNSATFIPQVGDLAVFDRTTSNVAGHISVCNGIGDTKSFQSLDQNWAGVGKATIVTHNYDAPKLLGVLRPKSFEITKGKVIGDIYEFLTGTRASQSEIDWRTSTGKNFVEIGTDICFNDERFFTKWVLPHIPTAELSTNSIEVTTPAPSEAPQIATSAVTATENKQNQPVSPLSDWFGGFLAFFKSKLGL